MQGMRQDHLILVKRQILVKVKEQKKPTGFDRRDPRMLFKVQTQCWTLELVVSLRDASTVINEISRNQRVGSRMARARRVSLPRESAAKVPKSCRNEEISSQFSCVAFTPSFNDHLVQKNLSTKLWEPSQVIMTRAKKMACPFLVNG